MNRFLQQLVDVRQLIEPLVQFADAARLKMRQVGSQDRKRAHRLFQRQQFAGVGRFQCNFAEQAFEVLDDAQHAAQFFARDGVFGQLLDGIKPRVELLAVDARAAASKP